MYNKPPNHHKLLTKIRTGKFAKSKLFTTFAIGNEQKQTTSGKREKHKVIQNGKLLLLKLRKSFPFLCMKNITRQP